MIIYIYIYTYIHTCIWSIHESSASAHVANLPVAGPRAQCFGPIPITGTRCQLGRA